MRGFVTVTSTLRSSGLQPLVWDFKWTVLQGDGYSFVQGEVAFENGAFRVWMEKHGLLPGMSNRTRGSRERTCLPSGVQTRISKEEASPTVGSRASGI